ncbi:cGMP-specific 3',5'-cyclic phosphodiesterase [Aplysia californica]|uniref:cGMP-specific 3',5'-cyclic phosphodiesterase n=1 Tax=Aplysia californica TaxID=6500 RepID=A0ABM0K6S8_APLCA|nr:cGMP-specific 3',5'-cyclic phosphodiesterase [Aplysia californica]
MMMTASDVAAITKPWEIQRKVAWLVASEFFEQGDIEKETLNLKPIAMMDREQIDKLPDLQVGFIDDICMPVYDAISKVSSKLSPLLEGCQQNRENWQMEARAANKRLEEQRVENADKDKEEDEKKEKHNSSSSSNSNEKICAKSSRDNVKEKEDDDEMELEEDEDTVVENVSFTVIPLDVSVKDGNEDASPSPELHRNVLRYKEKRGDETPAMSDSGDEVNNGAHEDRLLLLSKSKNNQSDVEKWKHSGDGDQTSSKHDGGGGGGGGGMRIFGRGCGGRSSSKGSSGKKRAFSGRERSRGREEDKSSTS